MRNLRAWMEEYGTSHRHPVNVRLHLICVPLIMASLFGILICVPWPFVPNLPGGWATLLALGSLVFYALLSWRGFFLMLATAAPLLWFLIEVQQKTPYLLWFSLGIFFLAWIGQLIGHKYEGAKPSFLKDLLFLWIGPLFVWEHLGVRL